jgi:SSS family transporter
MKQSIRHKLAGWLVVALVLAGCVCASAQPAPQPVAPRAVAVAGTEIVVVGPDAGARVAGGSAGWTAVPFDDDARLAAVAQAGDRFILVGGADDAGPTRRVRVVSRVAAGLRIEPLPDLPMPLAGAGAVVLQDQLYVAGGFDGVAASARLLRLQWQRPGAAWEELASLPAAGRVLPAVSASFGMVHVIGGRVAGDGGWVATPEVWTYRPRPIDGTTTRGWVAAASLPTPLAAASAVPSGQSHVLLFGGDDTPASADPLRVSPTAAATLAFHSVTDTWTPLTLEQPLDPAARVVRVAGQLRGVAGSDAAPAAIVLHHQQRTLQRLDYLAIAVYFLGMAAIGFHFARRNKSSDDFSLGGRTVPWWAGAVSMYATGVSSISLMAIPVMAFTSNLVFLIPVLFMLPAALIQARWIVPLLRRLEITSTYEYLERRFNTPLRLLASGQCISLQAFGRMSVVLLLPSLALSATTGLNVYASILLMGVLTTVYTSVGGFEAVVWTDVAQGFVMLFGPLLIIGYALGGIPGTWGQMYEAGLEYGKFTGALWTWDWTVMAFWIPLLAAVLNIAGFAGDQPIVQRVYATPERDVKRLQYAFAFLGVSVAVLVTAVGLSLFFYYHANPARLDVTMTNDQLVPRFIIDTLPAGIAGIIIAAIFAAAMSTMSSSMNSVGVLVSEDFYRRFSRNATDQRRLRLMKAVSYVVGTIGVVLALWMATANIRSIFESWSRLAALLGGGFVGIYLLGIFTTRANGVGAFAGAIASVIWTIFAERLTGMHWNLLGPSATLACVIVGYLVSLSTGGSTKDLAGLTVFTARAEPRAVPVPAPVMAPEPVAVG